jgi:hypothetical protein
MAHIGVPRGRRDEEKKGGEGKKEWAMEESNLQPAD